MFGNLQLLLIYYKSFKAVPQNPGLHFACSLLVLFNLPEVSGEVPWRSLDRLPHALLIAAILAMMGRLWMTNDTSLRCCLAKFCAWPRIPNPVISVAAWALKVCIKLAAEERNKCGICDNKIAVKPVYNSSYLTAICPITKTARINHLLSSADF